MTVLDLWFLDVLDANLSIYSLDFLVYGCLPLQMQFGAAHKEDVSLLCIVASSCVGRGCMQEGF